MPSNDLYDRQSNLNLKHYRTIIIVGVGGIGNWVALDCALCGKFDTIVLIDDDIVESTNLNRTIFEYQDIGQYKVDAVKNHILRRRSEIEVVTYITKTTPSLIKNLISTYVGDNSYYHSDIVVVDCRDDIYEDLYQFNCKLYKVGYDGMSMTIDGNPRLSKVWTQRGGSYSVTPSYVGSSQLIACLLLNDMTYPKAYENNDVTFHNEQNIKNRCEEMEDFPYVTDRPNGNYNDEIGRLNSVISFNASDILYKLNSNRNSFTMDSWLVEKIEEVDDGR